ncbi:MAG: C25 family cysteine peptidase [Bacteroidota bacterium]
MKTRRLWALTCALLAGTLLPVRAATLPEGITIQRDQTGYLIDFALPEPSEHPVQMAGMEFTALDVPGYGFTSEPGRPRLPILSFNLLLNPGAGMPRLQVVGEAAQERDLDRPISPAQEPWPRSLPLADRPFRYDRGIYGAHETLTGSWAEFGETFVVGGLRGIRITLRPFRYDPAGNRLRMITQGRLRIEVSGSVPSVSGHSARFDDYLRGLFGEFPFRGGLLRSNYLIITAPEFESALAPFVAHKQSLGYEVFVATTGTAGTTNTAIKGFIQARYDNPATRPEFVLLVGDVNRVPEWIGTTTNNPHTDLFYVLLDGPDYYADAHIGRFPADSLSHLERMISKSVFMENSVFALAKRNTFMASTDNWAITEGTHNFVIDSFFTPAAYLSNKRYTHTYNATTAQVVGDLNEGMIFAVYSGHGSVTSWADGPPMSQSDVRGLTNSVFPHVYSFSCLTGQFQSAECFGETWMRIPRGGAAYWGSSVTSYWDEDDILEKRLFKAMFADGLTQSTPMFNMAKSYLADHYGGFTATVKRYFEMYNLLGDPSIHTASFTANFGWVEGTVTSGGLPLEGVTVDFVEGLAQQGSQTGPDGIYRAGARVDSPAVSASLTLRARKFGYETWTDTVTIVKDDTVGRNIALTASPGGIFLVRTFRRDSSAMGAALRVLFGGQEVLDGATDTLTGRFAGPLPAGDYTLIVDAISPYATRTIEPVTVTGGDTTFLPVLLEPVLVPSVASLAETLVVGQTSAMMLSLRNSTGDSVRFRLSDETPGRARLLALPGNAAAGGLPAVESPKGSRELPEGPPILCGSGGPDPFGYRWIDSDEPGGPAFEWRDISALGTRIMGLGDDTNTGPYPLGFIFPFYGCAYSSVRFCTNGWLSFTSTSTAYTNATIPSPTEPNAAVFAFWDDLTFASGSGAAYYYADPGAQEFIVQYSNVAHIGSTGPYTFQIVLRPTGEILVRYLSMASPLNSASIGIENADGSMGLEVAENAQYAHDSLALRFYLPDASWITQNPSFGMIPPHGTQDIAVMFDAFGLQVGTTYATVVTMDVEHPDVTEPYHFPASLRVSPADSATLILSAQSVTFPITPLFGMREDTLTARNAGLLPLVMSSLEVTDTSYSVVPSSATLPPGDSLKIRVLYHPVSAGIDTGRIIILSNSQGQPRVDILLAGEAVGMPAAAVWPDSFFFAVPSGQDTLSGILRIRNTGTDTLRFELKEAMRNTAEAARSLTQQAQPTGAKEGGQDGPGHPVAVEGRGGPDAFGYTWVDSDEPGGPAFNWFDITSPGTPVTSWTNGTGDDGSVVVSLPFPFPFYGVPRTSLKICTNGWVGFDVSSTSNAYSNGPLPAAGTEPNDAIYPWWDDLDVRTSGSVHTYHDAPNSRFVVQYTNVPHYGTTTPGVYTFQVLLYRSGAVLLQYLNMQQTLNSSTIGIENGPGTIGLQVAYNAAYVHNNLAVLFTTDLVPWIAASADHGTIAPGDSQQVELRVYGGAMPSGPCNAMLLLTGNMPESVWVPVHAEMVTAVEGAPEAVPDRFTLDQNFPNPFNPVSQIRYGLPERSHVRLTLYNLLGERVATLVDEVREAGHHTAVVQAGNLASGVYFYRMEAGRFSFTRKMVLLR